LQEEIILFTQWSKGGVLVKSLMLIFIFTLTSNVVFNPAPAWAVDDSQRDTASETAEASKDAKGKLSGAAGGVGGFFSGIMNWIKSVTDSVNNMWGMVSAVRLEAKWMKDMKDLLSGKNKTRFSQELSAGVFTSSLNRTVE
jgi:hypothetical protein